MKNLILLLLIPYFSFAQTTPIPDSNFEQALINLGHDTAPINGSVLTSNINFLTNLDVSYSNISNLSGIEDFTALLELTVSNNLLTNIDISQNTNLVRLDIDFNQLTNIDVTNNVSLEGLFCDNNLITSLDVTQNTLLEGLTCFANQLTSLDVTQNTALTYFKCGENQLTSLDVTNNNLLERFYCNENQLTSLDVTQNTILKWLRCEHNQLSSIDVTQNINLLEIHIWENQLTNIDVRQNLALEYLGCGENQLTNLNVAVNSNIRHVECENNNLFCLNIKNGNNHNWTMRPYTFNNPNLTCIEVDDVVYANTNSADWSLGIDSWTSYSENCTNSCLVGLKENDLPLLSIYPNPTNGSITIDLEEMKSNIHLRLTNALGQVVLAEDYKSVNHINFDLDVPVGLYLLQLESDGKIITKKIIKK